MPILKTYDHKFFSNLETINKFISPVVITTFPISSELEKIAKSNTFDNALKQQLLDNFPQNLIEECNNKSLFYTNTFIVRSPLDAEFQQKITAYAQPHANNYDEIHHIIHGIVIFGFVTKIGKQVVLLLLAGEKIFIPAGVEHWAILTDDKNLTVITYKSHPIEKQLAQHTDTKIIINF